MIYNQLVNYNFIPKIIYKNDNSLVLEVENTGKVLNKTDNITNLKSKINYIKSVMEDKKIIHNDITLNNITTKNDQIFLLDFDLAYFLHENSNRKYDKSYCKKLPNIYNDNLNEYINNNKCLYHWIE